MIASPLSIGLPQLPCENGYRRWSLNLQPGLYQVSVIASAEDFPMESLYYAMQEFGNGGVRTGPWDYKPMVGSPLVPAYWVYLNGEKLGLWVFARVSISDLEAGIFRGRFAFRVFRDGEQELELRPYLDTANLARWTQCTLEPDPVDRLLPLPESLSSASRAVEIRQWSQESFSQKKRQQLTPGWKDILTRALGWAMDQNRQGIKDETGRWKNADNSGPMDMTAYIVGWRLFGNEAARRAALELLEELICQPGWGRPNEEIYGWDGDLVAIDPFRACIQAYFGLDLPPELKSRVREKLRYQGNRFVIMALLTRDYWGGSLLQDHGWRAILGFTECALHLMGEVDEARQWLEWTIPRFRSALAAMPPDGHLPASSYGSPAIYVGPLARLRQAWLEATGEDLYDTTPVQRIVNRLPAYITLPQDGALLAASSLFLQQMTARAPESSAAYWLKACLDLREETLTTSYFSFRRHAQGLFEGFTFGPASMPGPGTPPVEKSVYYFADAGLVIARKGKLRLEFQCGPWLGYHAYSKSDSPCDRMTMQVGPGSFTLRVENKETIVHPDSNYALRSNTRNSLLINGSGQYGDIGYPMSLPSWRWRGEQLATLRANEASGELFARMDLAPLYPEAVGLLVYTRDLILTEEGMLICRDRVALRSPQPLEWCFHTTEALGITSEDGGLQFGKALTLRVSAPELALESLIRPTPVVFSYTGSGKRFVHAAFKTRYPTASAEVEFHFHPASSSFPLQPL